MTWIGHEKSKAEIIAHWRKVLANPNAAPSAHWIAAEALRDLTKFQESETAPITQADPTGGADQRSQTST